MAFAIVQPADYNIEHEYYQQVSVINKGGYGVCVLMEDRRNGDRVAVKLLNRGHKINVRVEREVWYARLLRHPNVVAFRELFLTPTHLCIVMEYASGGELFQHLTSSPKRYLDEDESRYFFRQLIAGVEHCHKQGVCHRDLKLENILLDGSTPPRLKICDFGLSKGEYDSLPKTKVGTEHYWAPEVLDSSSRGAYSGEAADVWSCGVALYILLTGTYPFGDINDLKNFKVVQQRIRAINYSYPGWVALSSSCMELLGRIFKPADKRAKLPEIKAHPWFNAPLPPHYQQALDAMAAEAAAAPAPQLLDPVAEAAAKQQIKAQIHEARTEVLPVVSPEQLAGEEMMDDGLEEGMYFEEQYDCSADWQQQQQQQQQQHNLL